MTIRVHLFEHGLARCDSLICRLERLFRWWCEAELPRRPCGHIDKRVECFCADTTITISVCLREALQQMAVELLVLHARAAPTSLHNESAEIFLAPLHLALRLLQIQSRSLFANVGVNVGHPLIEGDEATAFDIDFGEESLASTHALLRRLEELSHRWSESKPPWQICCDLNHVIEILQAHLAVEIAVSR